MVREMVKMFTPEAIIIMAVRGQGRGKRVCNPRRWDGGRIGVDICRRRPLVVWSTTTTTTSTVTTAALCQLFIRSVRLGKTFDAGVLYKVR